MAAFCNVKRATAGPCDTIAPKRKRRLTLGPIDYVSLIIYFAFVLGIGWLAKRKIATSEDFLT